MLSVQRNNHVQNWENVRIALIISSIIIAVALIALAQTAFQSESVLPNKEMVFHSHAKTACYVTATILLFGACAFALPFLLEIQKSQTVVTPPLTGYWRPGSKRVGDRVEKGEILGEIEVMKMFIVVHAPASGRIVAICAPESGVIDAGRPIYKIA